MKRVLVILALLLSAYTAVNAQSNSNDSVKSASDDRIFDVVEQPPSFPGGQAALLNWLNSHVKWPEGEDGCVQGHVVVVFVVEKDGSISNPKVLLSLAPAFDKEAIRVVMSMPKWTPGRQNGQNVRVKYNVPVRFKVQ